MEFTPWGRRRFLKGLPATAAGVAVAQSLASSQRAFASRLEALPQDGADQLGEHYTLDPGTVYLNHGSIGTIPKAVQAACQEYQRLCESNPWLYMWGGGWEEPREQTRRLAADLLGCRPDETALTHNTTEGFNILAAGLPLGKGDEVLFSSLNHPGASICWQHQAAARGFAVQRFDFPLDRVPEMTEQDVVAAYADRITPRTRVLVFPHIDNMVGLRHPMAALTEAARSKGVELVAVDGAQSLGMIPVDVASAGVDFYAASPHKWVQSPKGLGVLFVRRAMLSLVRPIWVTWGQARWKGTARVFEDYGTRNLPELMALGDAIRFQNRLGMEAKTRAYRRLRDHLLDRVDSSSRLLWRSPRSWELGSSLYSVEVKGVGSQKVFDDLNRSRGFVFRAFGGARFNACRISPNVFNRIEEIDRFAELAQRIEKA